MKFGHLALTLFFCFIYFRSAGCFILFHSDGEHVLVGNHEDWVSTDGAVKINPPTANRYGSVIFTFLSEGWAQGGMNEKGLFFDAARTPYQEIDFDSATATFHQYIWQEVLDKAANVSEALKILRRYQLPELSETNIMLADADGNAIILGVAYHKLSIRYLAGDYLLQTNFNQWHPELSEEKVCWRHEKAQTILSTKTDVSVDNMRAILQQTHQDSLTVYSNIYDLKNRTVFTYNKRDFKSPITITLPDFFQYGDCMVSLDSLERDRSHWEKCDPIKESAITIRGKVTDQETSRAVPYANIGVFEKNIGTLSDPDGSFEISIPRSLSGDSIIFSSVGFKTTKIPVPQNSLTDMTVMLASESIMLKAITINDKKLHKKTARLGWMGGKDGVLPLDTIQGGGAVALLVESPGKPSFLDKLQVRLMYNSKDTIKLRFHIYAFDSLRQQPGAELLQKEIILRENKRFGWLRFDLSQYDILVSAKRFFVGFEWIDDHATRTAMVSGLREWELWKAGQFKSGNPKVQLIPSAKAGEAGLFKYHGNMMDWPGFQELPPFTGLMVETGKHDTTRQLRTFERKTSFGQWTEIESTLNAVITISY